MPGMQHAWEMGECVRSSGRIRTIGETAWNTYIGRRVIRGGGPKNNENVFMEGRGAVLPSAPAWCVYVTALRISWPSGVLVERSVGYV